MQLQAVKTAAATFIASMRISSMVATAHETPLSKPWIRHCTLYSIEWLYLTTLTIHSRTGKSSGFLSHYIIMQVAKTAKPHLKLTLYICSCFQRIPARYERSSSNAKVTRGQRSFDIRQIREHIYKIIILY